MTNCLLPTFPKVRAGAVRVTAVFLFLGAGSLLPLSGEERGEEGPGRNPVRGGAESVGDEKFAELLGNSPFLRPLDLSRSLVLTGVASIDGAPIAILVDRETDESHFVSGSPGPDGWKLLGIDGDPEELESVTARISVAGGGVVYLRYDPGQIKPEPGGLKGRGSAIPPDQARRIAEEARNFRQGLSSDGFPGAPPREVADRFEKLSEDQRGRIIYQMGEIHKRGVSGEERQKIFVRMIDGALQGRR